MAKGRGESSRKKVDPSDSSQPRTIRLRLAVALMVLVAVGELSAVLLARRHRDASTAAPTLTRHDHALIDHYLATHPVKKLQVGAGPVNLPGWLNTDIEPGPGQVYLDAAARFPFPDDTFRYVYAEQLIEHLTFEQGQTFLRESLRVLTPGGRLRLATPNLLQILRLFDRDKTPVQKKLMDFEIDQNHLSRIPTPETANLNLFVRAWGHQFLYDPPSLHAAIEAAGFKDVKDCALEVSDDPELRGLETHWKLIGGRELDEYSSQFVEARKP